MREEGNILEYKKNKKLWGYMEIESCDEPITILSWLNTVGCAHTYKNGCTMCHYNLRYKIRKIGIKKMMLACDELLSFLEMKNEVNEYGTFVIFPGGSFLDESEIPKEIREYILKRIAKNKKNYKKTLFRTDTRLEYVNEKNIIEIRKILGDDSIIKFGFGMESTNKLIREACVNKDLTSDFLDRLMILRNNNIYITASVLLKPPFLTEKEAIEDTLNSVKELLDNNLVDHVNVMTMSSKPLTIVRKLEEMGLYKLPSIWSTIEVIKLLGPNYGDRLSFRGLIMGDTLDDTRSAHGCNECSNKIMPQLLKISKYTPKKWKEFIRLANSIDCKCKKEWKKEINLKPKLNLQERIVHGIGTLVNEYRLNKYEEKFKK